MKKLSFYLILFSSILLITCQKEVSYETGGAPSHGSLLDDGSGDCLPKTVNGTYAAGTQLAATNTIQVSVNVTKTGKYTVFSDTVNGYYFRATGIFSTLGSNSITLKGFGNPAASGINNFLIQYDSSACNVAITVLPTGSGGPAAFTIQSSGTPAVCSTSGATGNYIVGTALGASNTDTFTVNVTTIGTYSVTSDTVNGIWFNSNGTGTFTATGSQQLILYGHGTPTGTAGIDSLRVTAGSSTCRFGVTVTSGAVGTLGGAGGTCTPATPSGTYTQGVALTSGNTVQIQITTTTAGAYNITTNTVSGFSFAASGNATLGSQPITLIGTGTPTASGAIVFTVTFGASTCTFTVNVTSSGATGTLGGAGGTCTPVTINGTYTQGVALTSGNTVQIQINAATGGAYNISTNTVSGFSFTGSGNATTGIQIITLNGTGTPTASGAIVFTVTFGTSNCTFTVNVAAAPVADYFPRTTNSNWSYEFGGVATDSLYVNVIASTLSALGNTYNIFMQNDGSTVDTSGYYRKSGNDYFHYVNLADYFSFDIPQWVEFNFIKDNQSAGFSWTTTGYVGSIGGNPITIRIKFTILQQDVPISLTTSAGTVNYPNTIVVQEQYEAFNGATWVSLDSSIGYFKDYYSRNIGWIMDEYYDTSGTLDPTSTMRLRRYVVF